MTRSFNREHLRSLIKREREAYVTQTPGSAALYAQGTNLLGGVPMTWMNKWSGGHPLYLSSAKGAAITDVDGNEYVDFALGDTGAMAGHSPNALLRALDNRVAQLGGVTTMLPTDDAQWVAAELTRRFGLPLWSYTLTATDANRWAIRIARMVTGRPKILTFSYSYHGSVDETFAVLDADGNTVLRGGNVGAPVPIDETTRAAEFNDLASVERALAHGDVAVVVTEPALTNIGIVLPEPGFLEGVRELCDKYGTLLLIDETHTFSAGPGGATKLWGLRPDIFVIGKSLGGGVPSGAYGVTQAIADQIASHAEADIIDVGGVGGTLAGNSMSTAAMRAVLGEVLVDSAFDHMIELATRFREGIEQVYRDYQVPWSVSQLGARVEYRFASPAPRTGTESSLAADDELEEYLHLYCINRGILITPFHNMALMCPATHQGAVDLHTTVFRSATGELFG